MKNTINIFQFILLAAIFVLYTSSCDRCSIKKNHCNNGIKDKDEIGVDCGGSCKPCPPPAEVISCTDNIKNGSETGVDCGGPCPACFAVNKHKELMIIAPQIVDSPAAKTGVLSFGQVMQRLTRSDLNAKAVILSFLGTWDNPVQINNITVAKRGKNREKIIDVWKGGNKNNVVSDANWNPDLNNTPFRLLAVNTRFDLANFAANKVGEARLTYGLKDANPNFTMIFEFNMKGSDRNAQIAWMKRWHQLSNMDQSATAFVDTLVNIVRAFSNAPKELSQLRTNEFLSDSFWELREFNIGTDGLFHEVTRKSSPTTELNGNPLLTAYVDAHGAEIENGIIRADFNGTNIIAGNALYGANFKWKAPVNASESQKKSFDVLNFLSCVGCHGGTFANTKFTHIKPRAEGAASQLSPFLLVDLEQRVQLLTDNLQLSHLPMPIASIDADSTTTTGKVILKQRELSKKLTAAQLTEIQTMLKNFSNVKRVH
jgi:hypothetical protein